MATTPRSPRATNGGKFNYEKEDTSFWEKLGTLGRKKKIKEGKDLRTNILFHKWKKSEIKVMKT